VITMVRNYKRLTVPTFTNTTLLEAVKAIHFGQIKIKDASKTYGISRATLYRHYPKYVNGGCKDDINQFNGKDKKLLKTLEENIMAKTIHSMADLGQTFDNRIIKRICFEYCKANKIHNKFDPVKKEASDDWYYGFLKRHPTVAALLRNKTKIKDATG